MIIEDQGILLFETIVLFMMSLAPSYPAAIVQQSLMSCFLVSELSYSSRCWDCLVAASSVNSFLQTFAGIDFGGKRLADEVKLSLFLSCCTIHSCLLVFIWSLLFKLPSKIVIMPFYYAGSANCRWDSKLDTDIICSPLTRGPLCKVCNCSTVYTSSRFDWRHRPAWRTTESKPGASWVAVSPGSQGGGPGSRQLCNTC